MVCRRLLVDDGRGVGEALNETVCTSDGCAGLVVSSHEKTYWFFLYVLLFYIEA